MWHLRSRDTNSYDAMLGITGTYNKAYEASTDEGSNTRYGKDGQNNETSCESSHSVPNTTHGREEKDEAKYGESKQVKEENERNAQRGSDETQPNKTWQVLATVTMSLVHLGIGTIFGYTGVTLPELTDPNTDDVFLDTNEAALFGSLSNLGGAAGCVLTGILLVRLGQRNTLFIGLPLTTAAWLGLAFAQTPWLLQAMRFVLGMTSGFTAPATSLYVLEISDKKLRGVFFGTLTTFRQVGVLVAYSLGSTSLGWRNVALTCAGLALLPFLGLFFLPNSPRWLVTQGRIEEARKSLSFYRGKGYDSKPELDAIIDQVGENAGTKNGFLAQLRLMRQPSTLRTLALLICLSACSSFSGHIIVTTYTVPILRSTEADLDAYMSAIIIGAVRVAGTIVHLVIIDRMGRKPLLVSSYSMCALSVAGLGGYFYMQNTTDDVSYLGWAPLTTMVLLLFFTGVGQPVVSIVQGELLPTSVRAAGVSIILILMFFVGFGIVQTFPLLSETIGEQGAFWVYTAANISMVLVGISALPETRGQSLEEITNRHDRRVSLTNSNV